MGLSWGSFGLKSPTRAFQEYVGDPIQSGIDSLRGKDAAKDAAKAQERAAEENIALQREMYEQTREDFTPYREMGAETMGALADMYGAGQMPESQYMTLEQFMQSPESQIGSFEDFQASPEYQFRLQEGLGAVESSAAAGGMLHSGRTLKDLTRFGQGLASQEYGNWYNRKANEWANYANRIGTQYGNQFQRMYGLANMGQSAAGMQANVGQAATSNIMAQNQAAADAQSAAAMQSYTGTANLINQGIQGASLYALLSDRDYKDGIEEEELGLDFINSLRPVTYRYKGSDEVRHGLIAQEVGQDFVVYDAEHDAYGVKYIDLIAPLIKAVQELQAKLEDK